MAMFDKYQEYLKDTANKVNGVSKSFCIAKWKQVTMHLQNGHTHSCHHPRTHYVPISEIQRNPTALHNSEYKKQQRKMMLEGVRPPECDYCWRVEDQGDSFSDRIYKSAERWAIPHLENIANSNWNDDCDPSYVEVSFGNVCNFKCSYCSPNISSQWMEEIQKWGPYPTTDLFNNLTWLKQQKLMPIPNRDENPYVDAFWQWWPKMYSSLQHFRITGGEPLLNKNTFKVLDYIIDNPNPNLEVSINSNLNPPDEVYEKFLEKAAIIVNGKKVKNFKIFTSAEAHGKQCEYIRYGMNYQQWLKNIYKGYDAIPELQFTVMSTYNLLSLTSYIPFLQDVLAIKRKYHNHDILKAPMMLDIPYLRYPNHQAVFIMPPEMLKYISDHVTFMYQNLEYKDWWGTANRGFFMHEADKLKRIFNVAKDNPESDTKNVWRKNFVAFVDEHDKRRGTNFLETFPEFEQSYHKWKTL